LKKRGWKIIATNYRFGKDELDILAMPPNQNLLVAVEVRSTRSIFGNPESTLSLGKRRAMARVARRLQAEANKNECVLRFDLITVRMTHSKPELRHYEGILPIKR
jgi:putative endonuclease